MEEITDKHGIVVAKQAFESVFDSADTFDKPFAGGIRNRILLFPTSYPLDERQYRALENAAKATDDCGALITVTEPPAEFELLDHWRIDLSSLDDFSFYVEPQMGAEYQIFESAVYSVKGNWGLLLSWENHGLVGGSEEFIESFKLSYGDVSVDLARFIRYWEDLVENSRAVTGEWIPSLIEHVYGMHPPIHMKSEILGLDI